MEDYGVAHAKQIGAFFAVVLAVIDPFKRERIVHRLDRLIEGDAVVVPVGGGFVSIPVKRSFINELDTSRKSKRQEG
jgi:hypothetical protein